MTDRGPASEPYTKWPPHIPVRDAVQTPKTKPSAAGYNKNAMSTLTASHHVQAQLIRKNSNTNLEDTAERVSKVLKMFGIPHLIVGGYAVQEHGYAYTTNDVDIVVPNQAEAFEKLSMNGFRPEFEGAEIKMVDRKNKVGLDVLQAGTRFGGVVDFPVPTEVSAKPNVVDLKTLIELKLSSYIGSRIDRAKDLGAVVELIKANDLPLDFDLDERVRGEYQIIWNGLKADQARRS